MTAKINISNLGNSLALPIPDYIVKFFNLKADDSVFLKTGKFRIPGKKALIQDSGYPEIVVMDVTETAIERPKKKH